MRRKHPDMMENKIGPEKNEMVGKGRENMTE